MCTENQLYQSLAKPSSGSDSSQALGRPLQGVQLTKRASRVTNGTSKPIPPPPPPDIGQYKLFPLPPTPQRSRSTSSWSRASSKRIRKALKLYEEIIAMRETILKLRVAEEQTLKDVKFKRREAQNARASLMKIVDRASALDEFQSCVDDLRSAAEQVTQTEQNLSLVEQNMSEGDNNLLYHGYQLQRKDHALRDVLHSILHKSSGSDVESDASSTHSSDSGFSIPTDPTLAQLYKCIGNIKVMRERLQLFKINHEMDLDFRQRRKLTSEPLSPSDTEFFNDYFIRYSDTENCLRALEKRKRVLRALCIQRHCDMSYADESSDQASDTASSSASSMVSEDGEIFVGGPGIQDKFPGLFRKPGAKLLSGAKTRAERVNRWILHVARVSHYEIWRARMWTYDDDREMCIPDSAQEWSFTAYEHWAIANSSSQSTEMSKRRSIGEDSKTSTYIGSHPGYELVWTSDNSMATHASSKSSSHYDDTAPTTTSLEVGAELQQMRPTDSSNSRFRSFQVRSNPRQFVRNPP